MLIFIISGRNNPVFGKMKRISTCVKMCETLIKKIKSVFLRFNIINLLFLHSKRKIQE